MLIQANPNIFVTVITESQEEDGSKTAEARRVLVVAWLINEVQHPKPVLMYHCGDDAPVYFECEDGTYDDGVEHIFETKHEMLAYHTRMMNPIKGQ
jgi:hypothetical protein